MNVNDLDFNDSRVKEFLAKQESSKIHWGDHYRMELLDLISNGDDLQGIKLPWSSTADKVRLGYGDVSIWAGINGHLKSFVLGQVAFHAAKEHPVGIASFELTVAKTMYRMTCQAAGTAQPAIRYANDFATWMNGRMAFYNRLDSVDKNRVLACVHHMATEMGCRLVVVDSLMMVSGIAGDAEAEKEFMASLAALAKGLDIHIALVHHVRKGDARQGDGYIPRKEDVKGNGAIMDLASLGVVCWNNKKKKEYKSRLDFGGTLSPDEQDEYDNTPDQFLSIVKQRHGEFEGKIPLWIHDSVQFVARNDRRAIPFDIPRMEDS